MKQHLNKTIKFELGLVIVLLAGLLAVGVVYLQGEKMQEEIAGTESESGEVAELPEGEERVEGESEYKTFSEEEFSLKTPGNWTREPKEENLGGTLYKYGSDNGNKFNVFVATGDFNVGADALWRIEASNSGFVITEEGEFCSLQESVNCRYGDGSLNIVANGFNKHKFTFLFGNNRQEQNVDLQVFRDILNSFEVK